jgi:hypothetical protein
VNEHLERERSIGLQFAVPLRHVVNVDWTWAKHAGRKVEKHNVGVRL